MASLTALATSPNRRRFLQGAAAATAGLTIGFHWTGNSRAAAAANDVLAPNAFVRVAPDNTVTVIDLEKRVRIGDVQVGVEPEGMAISPDGKILINTSETTNMAHFIDTATRQIVGNVLVDSRPRFAEFKRDGSELWVSSEIGGTVSVIDPAKHEVTGKITFSIPGLRREAIQPV